MSLVGVPLFGYTNTIRHCEKRRTSHHENEPSNVEYFGSFAVKAAIRCLLKNQPRSGGRYLFQHKRTFSQRASLSVGLSKFKMRSETTRGDTVSNGKEAATGASTNTNTAAAAAHSHHHFHNEGQFFVREMLRMGTKHRSHHIEERTLKLVAKCLIEVIEKQKCTKHHIRVRALRLPHKRNKPHHLHFGLKVLRCMAGRLWIKAVEPMCQLCCIHCFKLLQ
eukprot:328366_1